MDSNFNHAKSATKISDNEDSKFRIFVTVGSDVPFDRLVGAVDNWAGSSLAHSVFAQIGHSSLQPQNIQYCKFLSARDFKLHIENCQIVVAHAGMGTILSALQNNKPILVMPRIGSRGETRNEHQMATVKYLSKLDRINVVNDENELVEMLDQIGSLSSKTVIGPWASGNLIRSLSEFIHKS